MNDTTTLYKLILLYIASKLDTPLTEEQLFEYLIVNDYASYFKCKDILSNLVQINYIAENKSDNARTLYTITSEGCDSIAKLKNVKINRNIQEDINEFLSKKGLEYKEYNSTPCNYTINSNGEYDVNCKVIDNGITLLSLTLSVPTETQAIKAKDNWRLNKDQIYKDIINGLI